MASLDDMLLLLPQNALVCLVKAVTASTCGTDVSCICGNEAITTQTTNCIRANCTIRESLSSSLYNPLFHIGICSALTVVAITAAQNITNTLCGIESIPDYSYVKILMPFMALACIAVLLRLAARFFQGVKFWWDDVCNMFALICCVSFSVMTVTMRDLGMGHDIWAVPQERISPLLMNYYVNFLMYAIGRLFIRLSIVLFFIRIFTLATARNFMIFTSVLVVSSSTAFILTIIFQCTPVKYFWLRWDGEHDGTCIKLDLFMRASAIIAICVDFWQILVPVPFVLRLNLSLKKRLLVVLMFTVGISVIVLSIIRYPTIKQFTGSQNPTRKIIQVGFWSALELDVGVICACLPSLQSIFKLCINRRRAHNSSGFVEMTPTPKNSSFNSGNTMSADRIPAPHVRRTIAIQQETLSGSEEHLTTNPIIPQGLDIEIGTARSEKKTIYKAVGNEEAILGRNQKKNNYNVEDIE